MATAHVSEQMIKAKAVGGARHGIEQEVLVAADLSSLAAAKAAVIVDSDKKHVSERSHIKTRVNPSLDLVNEYDSSYATGTTALKASMIALSPQRNGSNAARF
jgi:hypothetical protein